MACRVTLQMGVVMLQGIMSGRISSRSSKAQDRRDAHRIELMSPFIVSATFDSAHSHLCLARNVGVGGLLLEFQTESELSGVSDGFRCVLTDMMPEGYHTMQDVHCSVEWLYRKFVGVAFSRPFFMNHDALLEWMKSVRMSYRLVENAD